MKTGGWVAIVASVVVVAAAAAAVVVYETPQKKRKSSTPTSSPDQGNAWPPKPERPACECEHLKTLQIELRNAQRLQQAFRGKVPDLGKMNGGTSKAALQQFAAGDARKGLETIPDYKGPSSFDYDSWGDSQDPDQTHKYSKEKLCALTSSASQSLVDAMKASACAGIATALDAHERHHHGFCVRLGYLPYLNMHGADRAQEEVEAYGAQIAVLQAEIARVLKEQRCGYRASGQTADVVYSGAICSLEKPFTVTGKSSFATYPFMFTPTSSKGGTAGFGSQAQSITMAGGGTYVVEGEPATPAHRIAMTLGSVGHTAVGSRSGGGTVYINLAPLDTGECK